jgi:flagellar biosynthesis/type III secretory pathway protein FliH
MIGSASTHCSAALPRWLGRGAVGLMAGATLALAACATAPKEQLAVARAEVDRAAATSAEAPVELASARAKLERANLAMANKDYRQARELADEAAADAGLAEARARSARSQRALNEVNESIRQLRAQLDSQ